MGGGAGTGLRFSGGAGSSSGSSLVTTWPQRNETEKQLMDAWSGVETGAIEVEDAQRMVSTEKQLEKNETEEK